MQKRVDEILLLNNKDMQPLPAHSMRDGLLGKTLEDALQTILEKYPQIIPGKQIDPISDDPPRFVLLRREMPVAGWSLDHLYVDQRGVLTLVETKLIQNPESRREVIGQMIEYAANASEYWGNEKARRYSIEFWNKKGVNLDDTLKKEFGEDLDISAFWATVEENLKNGRIRMMIAADELWPEVRRMIEYLNGEMSNAEVLGLELKCYGDDNSQMVLVPLLVGQSKQPPVDGTVPSWPLEKLKESFDNLKDSTLRSRLYKVMDWAVSRKSFIEAKAKFPTFGMLGKGGKLLVSFYCSGNFGGNIYLYFEEIKYPGGTAERDALIKDMKENQMLDADLDPYTVVSGRNLKRKLGDLSDADIDKLLTVLGKYVYGICG